MFQHNRWLLDLSICLPASLPFHQVGPSAFRTSFSEVVFGINSVVCVEISLCRLILVKQSSACKTLDCQLYFPGHWMYTTFWLPLLLRSLLHCLFTNSAESKTWNPLHLPKLRSKQRLWRPNRQYREGVHSHKQRWKKRERTCLMSPTFCFPATQDTATLKATQVSSEEDTQIVNLTPMPSSHFSWAHRQPWRWKTAVRWRSGWMSRPTNRSRQIKLAMRKLFSADVAKTIPSCGPMERRRYWNCSWCCSSGCGQQDWGDHLNRA